MAFVKIDEVNLYYEVSGNENCKTAIAFFNGVMASVSSWDGIAKIFEGSDFKIVKQDFRGQLKSDKPNGPYTFAQHVEDSKKIFEEVGVNKVHIIGTSYGGEVAMKFAVMYPEMVKTISIIDSVSELDEVLRSFVDNWLYLCDLKDGEKFFRGMAPSIYGNSFYTKNKETLDARARMFSKMPQSYFDGQKILYETFKNDVYMTNELKNIKCPALVIVGQDDLLKRIKFSDIIAREIPNSEYIIIPDCGHVAILEKVNELNSMLYGFIMKNNR